MVFVLIAIVVLVLFTLLRAVRIIPQAKAGVVERLGKYHRTLTPGLAIVIPYVDRTCTPSSLISKTPWSV